MNKDRRKQLAEATDLLSSVRALIEEARDDEQEYLDNMPEQFQSGDRGQQAEAAVGALDEAVSALEEAEASLETATE